jgi:hypothetical protein
MYKTFGELLDSCAVISAVEILWLIRISNRITGDVFWLTPSDWDELRKMIPYCQKFPCWLVELSGYKCEPPKKV